MKRQILALTLVMLGGAAVAADAAFVIRLRNGNEFVTTRYWQEGQQVLFDAYGGIVGIAKAFIAEVEPTGKLAQPPPVRHNPTDNSTQADTKASNESPTAPGHANTPNRDEHDPLLKEFTVLKQKSSAMKGMLTSELQEFSQDVAILKRKIQTSGKSNNYLDEFTELHKMGDELEELLRARG